MASSSSLKEPKGDTSLFETTNFISNPVRFVTNRVPKHGCTFKTKLLGKTTFVASTHESVKTMENKRDGPDIELGYGIFVDDLFGPNVLTATGQQRAQFSACIARVFSKQNVVEYLPQVRTTIQKHTMAWSGKVCAYEVCKKLCEDVIHNLVWGNRCKNTPVVEKLLQEHFHGMTSIPVSARCGSLKTSYAKAKEALDPIKVYLQDALDVERDPAKHPHCILDAMNNEIRNGQITKEDALTHLLLFSCHITSKGIASMLCSILLMGAQHGNMWEHMFGELSRHRTITKDHMNFLKETFRVRPPIAGILRKTTQDTSCEGYKLPGGKRFWGCIWTANRDPKVYDEPDAFCPDRWNVAPAPPPPTTFGKCSAYMLLESIGLEFILQTCMAVSLHELPTSDAAEVMSDQEKTKWVPTVRPKGEWKIVIARRVRQHV
jgi:cytochrome P450